MLKRNLLKPVQKLKYCIGRRMNLNCNHLNQI